MWTLATALGIVLFFVLLLAIPVDLVFCIEKDVDFKPRIGLRWMFGLIKKDISGKKEKPKKKEKREKTIKPLLAMLGTRGFSQRLLRFIRDSFRLLSLHELKLNLRVGLDDPAETGLLFAAIEPAMVYIRPFSSLDAQVEPDFGQENLRGYCKGDVRAFPIQLVGPFILFAFSTTTIRAIRAMLAARRK